MKTDFVLCPQITQIYTDFFFRLRFCNLRKSAKSVDDRFCFLRWLVAREWRQEMRQQLIADLLALNSQPSTCF